MIVVVNILCFYDFAGEYAGYLNAFPCYISGEAFFAICLLNHARRLFPARFPDGILRLQGAAESYKITPISQPFYHDDRSDRNPFFAGTSQIATPFGNGSPCGRTQGKVCFSRRGRRGGVKPRFLTPELQAKLAQEQEEAARRAAEQAEADRIAAEKRLPSRKPPVLLPKRRRRE